MSVGWLPQLIQPSIVLHLLQIPACGIDERGRRDPPGWSVDGTEGVAPSANASGRRGKVEEGTQPLDLDVDLGGAPERGVVIKEGFKNLVDVRRV